MRYDWNPCKRETRPELHTHLGRTESRPLHSLVDELFAFATAAGKLSNCHGLSRIRLLAVFVIVGGLSVRGGGAKFEDRENE